VALGGEGDKLDTRRDWQVRILVESRINRSYSGPEVPFREVMGSSGVFDQFWSDHGLLGSNAGSQLVT